MPARIESEVSVTEKGFRTVPIETIEPPHIDVIGHLVILASHKRLILGITLLVTIAVALAATCLPPVYTATAVILPPQQRPGLGAFLSQVNSTAPIAGADLMRSPADLYIALLASRSVADSVIASVHLQQHYAARSMTVARRTLAGRTRCSAGRDTLVRIDVRDREAGAAAAIANAYIAALYDLTSRFSVAESEQRRGFYQKQLESESQELAATEAAMRAIQEKTGLVQVNSQVDVAIRSVAQVRAEITSREVMLEGIQQGATDQNPDVIRLRAELASLRARLRQLESAPAAGDISSTLLPTRKVPGAGLEYLRALRQLRYHESLYEALARQHEAARLDEAKRAPVVQVVDYAIPPEYPSGPRRRLSVVLAALSSAALASLLVLAHARLAQPSQAARLRPLAEALWTIR